MFLNLFTLETFLNLRYMSITMSKLDKTLATSNHSVDTKPKSASWRYTIKANQKLFHEEQGRAIQNNTADVETKNVSTKTRILLCHAWLGGNKTQMCKTYNSALWHHDLHTLLRASGIWAVSEERASPWLAHVEDWIILLGEQRLLSALSERRPVTDGHLHRLSWLLSSSIAQIPYLHVSLPQQTAQRNDGSQEEQTANEITATTSPSLSFYFQLARSHIFSLFTSCQLMFDWPYWHNWLPISKRRKSTVPQSITVKGCDHGSSMEFTEQKKTASVAVAQIKQHLKISKSTSV